MMQTILIAVLTAAQAYLLGSVDTGILISKFVYHDDVRNHGSGAAGMTNMLRTFGKKAAALTAAGDVLKGVAAVCIGRWLFRFLPADAGLSAWLGVYLAAILAVVSHLKPLYFGFKGGKGVLTSLGVVLMLNWVVFALLVVLLLPVVFIVKIVSLTVIIGYILFPFFTLLINYIEGQPLLFNFAFALLMSCLGAFMHRENIKRLLAGTEYRFGQKKEG